MKIEEEFNNEENKLITRYKEQLKSIKEKYSLKKVPDEYEPGDSPELIKARSECKNCRVQYKEDYDNLKKQFFNSYNDIETKNKELENKLKNKDNEEEYITW